MIISLIAAMDENRGIGLEGEIPWHLSADLRRFKALTMGHHLIMGRKTFESIGRPLPGRTTIIITRNPGFQPDGCLVVHSLDRAINLAQLNSDDEVFIIGGGEIFEQSLEFADRIYLTLVHTHQPADVFFPEYNQDDWQVQESEYLPADESNQYPSTFMILEKSGEKSG